MTKQRQKEMEKELEKELVLEMRSISRNDSPGDIFSKTRSFVMRMNDHYSLQIGTKKALFLYWMFMEELEKKKKAS